MFKLFRSHNTSLPMSLLYILIGLAPLFFPGQSGTLFCLAPAVAALIYSLSRFWFFYQARKEGVTASGTLTLAIIVLALGIFCLVRADIFLSILPLTLGVLLLLVGIGKLPLMIDALSARSPKRVSLMLAALVPLVLGIIMIANPFETAKAIIRLFGVGLLADGICDLVTVILARREEKSEYKDID